MQLTRRIDCANGSAMGRRTYRLGRGASTFCGFAPWVPGRLIRDVDVRLDAPLPPPTLLENVLCLPKRRALYDAGGARIALSAPTYLEPDLPPRRWQAGERRALDQSSPAVIPVPERPVVVEEPVLYLGTFVRHYGLFLMDALSRAWALEAVDPAMKVVFAPPAALDSAPPFVTAILAALGVSPDRVIQSGRNLLLRKVLVPLPAMQAGRRIYGGYDAPHRWAGAVLGAGGTDAFAGRCVYLSRTRLPGGHRTIAGETALEQRLEREDFAIAHPQEMSLSDQIALFDTARAVVGQAGSAMHTALFRRAETPLRLACLTWGDLNGRFLLTDAIRPHDSWYLDCLAPDVTLAQVARRALGREDVALNRERFRLNVDRAMDLLSDASFLSGGQSPAGG